MNMKIVGRFAPSPSGRMHLGNIYTAVMSWLSVKSRDGRWILRIEDLDPQRSKMEYARIIEDDLLWLGLEWDEGGIEGKGSNGPYLQSERHELYQEALDKLMGMGLCYPCTCTRAEILATQAPHESDGRVIYKGNCRPEEIGETWLRWRMHEPCVPTRRQLNHSSYSSSIRIFVPDEDIKFTDMIQGPQCVNLAQQCGDFIVKRSDGAWAYQLAVVVDDALMGVTEVMRGKDLLLSTAQQIYLYRLLGYTSPEFAHLPLITNENGIRLSKRDKSLSMEFLREHYSPEELLGMVAYHARIKSTQGPISLQELLSIYPAIHQSPLRGY